MISVIILVGRLVVEVVGAFVLSKLALALILLQCLHGV